MWNISPWSAKCLVSHHFKWRTWPGRGPKITAFCGGAPGSAFSFLSCSGRSTSLDWSSGTGLRYSAGSLTIIGRNISHSHWKIGESTQEASGHGSYHYPGTSLRFSVSPNTNENHTSCHLCTLCSRDAPLEEDFSTCVFSCACWSSVQSRSMRCPFSFGIGMSGISLASFNPDHHMIVQGFAICIIRCAAFCWASSSSVKIACIKLFTAECNASALCVSITVSASGSSGTPENSHVIWKHQS